MEKNPVWTPRGKSSYSTPATPMWGLFPILWKTLHLLLSWPLNILSPAFIIPKSPSLALGIMTGCATFIFISCVSCANCSDEGKGCVTNIATFCDLENKMKSAVCLPPHINASSQARNTGKQLLDILHSIKIKSVRTKELAMSKKLKQRQIREKTRAAYKMEVSSSSEETEENVFLDRGQENPSLNSLSSSE